MTPDPGRGLPPFAAALKRLRVEHHMTQVALANVVGVTDTAVRQWEQGDKVPSPEKWAALKATFPELPPTGDTERTSELQARVRELEELTGQLQKQVRIDALTGVLNECGIHEALDKTVHAAYRHGEPVAVAYLDLDKFKAINDEHGHAVGDEVLKAFAATVAGSIRKEDSFGRDGGEEFLLVYANTNLQMARIQAERVRQRVEALEINGLRITVSIGVAALPPTRERLSDEQCKMICAELVKRADTAAYWSKEDGRNRVDFWETGREEARAARKAKEAAATKPAAPASVPPTLLARIRTGWAATRVRETVFSLGVLIFCGSFASDGGCFAPSAPTVPSGPPGGKDDEDT